MGILDAPSVPAAQASASYVPKVGTVWTFQATTLGVQNGTPSGGTVGASRVRSLGFRHSQSDTISIPFRFPRWVNKVGVRVSWAPSTSRTDTAGTTTGSPVVTDTLVSAADQGKPVSGTGIPANTFVGTVIAGTSFRLSSSSSSQVDVNATVTNAAASVTISNVTVGGNVRWTCQSDVWPDNSAIVPGVTYNVTDPSPVGDVRKTVSLADDLVVDEWTNFRIGRLGTDAADTTLVNANIFEVQFVATDVAPTYTPTTRLPTIPAATMIAGANIAPRGPWPSLWSTDTEWTDWVKPQIDNAKSLGLNAIRMQGSIGGLAAGTYTMAQYLARWNQRLDYIASLGMYAYVTGGGFDDWGGATDAQAAGYYAQWAAMLATHNNVIGVDISNEGLFFGPSAAYGGSATSGLQLTLNQTVQLIATLSTAIKGACNLPVSQSLIYNNGTEFNTKTQPALIERYVDFYDIHLTVGATSAPTPAEAALFFNHRWAKKPILFGEFSRNAAQTTANRQAYYNDVKTLLTSRPEFIGGLAYAMADQNSTDNTKQFGLWDLAGNPRTDLTTILATFPKTRP